jgi:hypothetical protein
MNFIETLRSVGGVKPCDGCTNGKYTIGGVESPAEQAVCGLCHGTGRIIDLAPLLAKPKDLERLLPTLLYGNEQLKEELVCNEREVAVHELGWCVVGPQRAHSLVCEVARQLGGTAVVAEPKYAVRIKERFLTKNGEVSRILYETVSLDMTEAVRDGYHLALHIPDTATVLFVTDRVDEIEFYQVLRAVTLGTNPKVILPFLLCLIKGEEEAIKLRESVTIRCDSSNWGRDSEKLPELLKILSLYQEKP